MSLRRLFICGLISLAFILSNAATAGEVQGIFTLDGEAVNGGSVTLYDRNSNQIDSVITDEQGQYRLYYKDAGSYYLTAIKEQATSGFIELQLTGDEKNLDLNILVTNRTINIKGRVTATDGSPVSFAQLALSSDLSQSTRKQITTNVFGEYNTNIDVPNFDTEITIDLWLIAGSSRLNNVEFDYPVFSHNLGGSIFVPNTENTVTRDFTLPNFSPLTFKLSDLGGDALVNMDLAFYEVFAEKEFRLGGLKTDSAGELKFYFPQLDEASSVQLRVSAVAPSQLIGDFVTEFIEEENNPNIEVNFDKQINEIINNPIDLRGQVAVIDIYGTQRIDTATTVSVMNQQFELIESIDVNDTGAYQLTLDQWGSYYVRADNGNYRSAWQLVSVRGEDGVDYNISVDESLDIIDVNGSIQTENNHTLGRATLIFSSDDLPLSLYSLQDEQLPSVKANRQGDFIISLLRQRLTDANSTPINYQISTEAGSQYLIIDDEVANSFVLLPKINQALAFEDLRGGEGDDNYIVTFPNLFNTSVQVNGASGSGVSTSVSLYEVIEGENIWLTSFLSSENGSSRLYLANDSQLDDAESETQYLFIPDVPRAYRNSWLPPENTLFTFTADSSVSLVFGAHYTINVVGNIKDKNGNLLQDLMVGFYTSDLPEADYTRSYAGRYPHQISNQQGEYSLNLRAEHQQSITYTASNRNCVTCGDDWAAIEINNKKIPTWLGQGYRFDEAFSVPADPENNQFTQNISLPIGFQLATLTLEGSQLSNVEVRLYHKTENGNRHISTLYSNGASQVQAFLPEGNDFIWEV